MTSLPAPDAARPALPTPAPTPAPTGGGRPRATVAAGLATGLAALVLLPVFRDAAWLWSAWLVVAAVGLAGYAARLLRLPVALHPVLSAAVLLSVLTTMFARPGAALGFLPGPVALGDLRELAQLGLADAAVYATPAPATVGLRLLTVGGIGLVALVVDVIGVSLRQPALAGVPLLALYAVPAALLRGGVPWWVFPVAAAGWLMLLAVDERDQVLAWGRVLGARRTAAAERRLARAAGPNAHSRAAQPRARLAGIGSSGRRLGAVALVAAVVVPAVIPGLSEPIWGNGRGGSGTGAGGVAADEGPVTIDPFVSLRRDIVEANDREIIRYYTDDPDPSYLRLASLERFDGTTWRPGRPGERRPLDQALPLPDLIGVADVRQAAYNIGVGELDNEQLPLPFPAMAVRAEGDSAGLMDGGWNWDVSTRTISADGLSSQGQRYQVSSLDVRPTRTELQAASGDYPAELRYLTEVPADLGDVVPSLAQQITASSTTTYDKAVALQTWFAVDGGFRYSTSVRSGNDAPYLEQFLTEKVGYCEQFAAAMALMARTLDIPARVTIGFTAGEPQGDGTWKVTVRDAHAWPELWLDGIGWVYFEPTPRAEPGSGVIAPPYAANGPATPDTTPSDTEVPTDPEARRGLRSVEEAEIARFLANLPGEGDVDEDAWRRWLLGALAVLLLAALAVPALVRTWRRRRRLAAADALGVAEGAWAELRDTARDCWLPWSDADTPRQAAGHLVDRGRLVGAPQAAVATLTAALERARYARPAAPDDASQSRGSDRGGAVAAEAARLRDALATVRRSLRSRLSWRARLRSVLLPPSVLGRSPGADPRADLTAPPLDRAGPAVPDEQPEPVATARR